METTDFHSLPRRDLQALCKMHKIPANMTNVAMADALVALFVEGVPGDDLAAAQEPKTNMKASRTTTARQNALMSKTGRSSRRGASKGEERKEIDGIPLIELPDTPVVPSGRKTRAREAMKTPGVVDATGSDKKQEGEEVAAELLNSKRASARSMRSRKKVSFALGEDGEGERGFVNEVKKTPVAPRIRVEEEMETGRCGTGRSVSGRATSQRSSGRLKAVPKMADLSATEERGDEEEVPILEKQEIVVVEEEASDSVITHEAGGHDEEGVQSSERIGSEEIPEDVNPTADIAEAVAEEKSDDQLTSGDVTAGEEIPTDSEVGDLTVSTARAPASEDVGDSSLEASEAVVEASGSAVADADESVEDSVDESIVSGTAAVADIAEAVAEKKCVDQLTADITAREEEAFELHPADSEDGDLTDSSARAPASDNVGDSSLEVSEAAEEAFGSAVVDADKSVEDSVDEAIVSGLDGTAAVADIAEASVVEKKSDDQLTADVTAGEEEAFELHPADSEGGDLTVNSARAPASDNVVYYSSLLVSEAVVEAVGSAVVVADEPVEDSVDESIVSGFLDVTAAVADIAEAVAGEEEAAVNEDDVMVDVPEVQEVEPFAEDIDHVAEVIEDAGSSDDANCVAGDGSKANGKMPEDPDALAEDGEVGCGNVVMMNPVVEDLDEVQQNVPGEGMVAALPVVVARINKAAECGKEVDELMEDLMDVPKTAEHPEACCDNDGVDDVTEDREEQENVLEKPAAETLPGNGDELPVDGPYPVIEAADHGEEGAEENLLTDSNEPPTEAAGEGGIPVENIYDVVVCGVTVAETGSEEITVSVSEAASCDTSMVELETLTCDVTGVDPIVETALPDLEQIVEAMVADGGTTVVEQGLVAEELPEDPEVGLPVNEEEIIPTNTEHVDEISELIQENVAPLLASCIGEPNATLENIQIPMATPTKYAAVEAPCSAKKSALSGKELGVSDNKENAVVILYSSNNQPVVENGTENKMKKKNGLPTPAELERMSLRQLRKQLEALSVHDSNHKRHENVMVLMSGKKAERKRTALATLPDNCLKSPQPGRC